MRISTEIGGRVYTFDLGQPIPLSIPLQPGGPQPSLFGVPAATARPYQGDGWVGSTRMGGSCNFNDVALNPHCNGTHTETLSHLTHQLHPIGTELHDLLVPATVLTLRPQPHPALPEHYPHAQAGDPVLTAQALLQALEPFAPAFRQALVVRTHPHTGYGPHTAYPGPGGEMPPFPTLDFTRTVAALGCRHLVLDVPSIDRLLDQGQLLNHRLFWNLPPTGHEEGDHPRRGCTLTEFAYPPATLPDGPCLLSIQVPHWVQDAAPSRLWAFRPVG